jgi:uncharacterized protein (DUF433 family)
MTDIVRDDEHSDGAPTVGDTGIRVLEVASAYEHSGYSPDGIVDLYPALDLEAVQTALAYYYGHVEECHDRRRRGDAWRPRRPKPPVRRSAELVLYA